MKSRILIIDDDTEFINDLTLLLRSDFECFTATKGGEGLHQIHVQSPDCVLLDLMLDERENGLDLLKRIQRYDETIPIIMVTDYASVDTAVKAIQQGAYDYISKTPNIKELTHTIRRALKHRADQFNTTYLKEEVSRKHRMIGKSRVMDQIWKHIELYAGHRNTVLITGESGVGKELVARQIHAKGPYKDEPFVAVNCAAIPRELVESELFGHEKGAFTGAEKRSIGKFEMAGNGVIFLDEISELNHEVQVKLLRVLQEREFQRVGGNSVLTTNAKVISATNRDLWELTQEDLFREDLYYRLDVLPIHVPPLRERRDDIPELVEYFINETSQEMKISAKSITSNALNLFRQYDWPGNIRQLKNIVIRAVILAQDDKIHSDDVDPLLKKSTTNKGNSEPGMWQKTPRTWDELDTMRKQASLLASRAVEKRFIDYLMEKFDHNISRAAEHIGINRTNLHKMIRRVEEEEQL